MVFSWYFMSLNWLIECIDASNEMLYFEVMFIFISDFSWFILVYLLSLNWFMEYIYTHQMRCYIIKIIMFIFISDLSWFYICISMYMYI